jgi:hypothetical protein
LHECGFSKHSFFKLTNVQKLATILVYPYNTAKSNFFQQNELILK